MRFARACAGLIGIVALGSAACSASPSGPSGGQGGAGAQTSGSGGHGTATGGTGGEDLITVGSTSSASAGGTGGTGGQSCTSGAGGSTPMPEVCNGKDDDLNGFIDEGCTCAAGATQMCFPGTGDVCQCVVGQQTCIQAGEFGQWGPCEGAIVACMGPLDDICEVCGNGIDDDCDGMIDEGCEIDLDVDIDGDCVTATCPPQAPNPIGCNIVMSGNDPRGCVAHAAGSPVVYFQEGDQCGAGHVDGTLKCSSVAGAPLDAINCPINKSQKFYPSSPNGCP